MKDHVLPVLAPPSTLIMMAPPASDHALADVMGRPWDSVIMVEPEADRARRLQKRTGVQIIPAAIGPERGQKPLIRFNFPGLRSLFEPTAALSDLLPGLREIGRIPVDVITPDDLARQLQDLPRAAELHIEAPGAEWMILQALHGQKLLQRIARLQLRCGTHPMAEGALPRNVLETWIKAQGFAFMANRSTDPDWCVLEFESDLVHPGWAAAQEEAARQESRIAELEGAAAAAMEDCARLVSERDSARRLSAQQIGDLENARQAALHSAAQAQQGVAAKEAERAHLQMALESCQHELHRMREERDLALERYAQQSVQVADLEQKMVQSQKAAEQLKVDLGFALRMQMLAQSDLRDLQIRYAGAEQTRSAQQALLERLVPRLQRAARHMQQCAAASGDLPLPKSKVTKKAKAKDRPSKKAVPE
ncbi:hypothetical protein [Pseudorhodobacter sp. MZDSW-24AT]|uniref:hypothetical protein n=1 Tax=Pseudorhodobacter sp. MZDSW-24AT TaxID=2052957 RepID=UPI000C1E0176|nr:hypothetical protein [Pseudorhodobacter sp. MZDSW-24AT]PJF08550.1 hypothetical protein CUR21_14125 [Pseudorhodobacter sp. MZDSW-24AT]